LFFFFFFFFFSHSSLSIAVKFISRHRLIPRLLMIRPMRLTFSPWASTEAWSCRRTAPAIPHSISMMSILVRRCFAYLFVFSFVCFAYSLPIVVG
jgi:hypothetical protein